jgi:hypothetical protein
MLSNGDIWGDNKSQDDSKQFIETFNEKKKNSQFKDKAKANKDPLVKFINLD